jgi:hypothetical protein
VVVDIVHYRLKLFKKEKNFKTNGEDKGGPFGKKNDFYQFLEIFQI